MTRLPSGTLLGLVLSLAACSTAAPVVSTLGVGEERLAADKSTATLLRVADTTRASGDTPGAIGLYRRAARNAQQTEPQNTVPLARLAEALAEVGAYDESVQAWNEAIALAPEDAALHRGLAAVMLRLGKPALALTHLEGRAKDARGLSLMGIANDLLGRYQQAQELYRAGLAIAPDHLGLQNNLGLSQALAGDFPAAIATLRAVTAAPGATARYRQNLALVYGLSDAPELATSVARADLDDASIRNNLAYYALLRGMEPSRRAAAILGVEAEPAAGATARVASSYPAAQVAAQPTAAAVSIEAAPLPPAAAALPARADAMRPRSGRKPPPSRIEREEAQPDPREVGVEPALEPEPRANPANPAATAAPSLDPTLRHQFEQFLAAKGAASSAAAPALNPDLQRQLEAFVGAPAMGQGPAAPTAPKTAELRGTAGQPPHQAPVPAAHRHFVVQAGAFRSEGVAQALADRLEGGFGVVRSAGRSLFVVRSPEFATRNDAAELARRIATPQIETIVVPIGAPGEAGMRQSPPEVAPLSTEGG